MAYHYAFDAAALLKECLGTIQEVIEHDEVSNRLRSANASLYDMREALEQAERQLYFYFVFSIEREGGNLATGNCVDLESSVAYLRIMLKECSLQQETSRRSTCHSHNYYPRRSPTDSLLFRLNVALQLCVVRINDARRVICGVIVKSGQVARSICITTACIGATAASLAYFRSSVSRDHRKLETYRPLMLATAKTGAILMSCRWTQKKWSTFWMTSKLARSTEIIEEWNRQWILVQGTPQPKTNHQQQQTQGKLTSPLEAVQKSADAEKAQKATDAALDAARSRRLIEYAMHETPKTSFWHSQGELRFLMLKRAMDIFYASVGTAMDLTHPKDTAKDEHDAANWQLTVVTAAAASFYSLTGARDRAATVTSSSESASKLIQNAWGMVSLPAVKNLSLQASSLLKGAAVADRIEICGVHCFILCSEPAPELAAAIKRNRRLHQRRKPIATLSTIDEQEEHTPATRKKSCSMPFARSSTTRYRQRDVIFHLTGGGFFAHIIASDLPYLLDWSASTGAVVICPEYALLPEHTFPTALHQLEDVYHSLVSDEAVSCLGFETNKIVLTGESAGGNLAAALCIKICINIHGTDTVPDGIDKQPQTQDSPQDNVERAIVDSDVLRMPNALMLSCPVLNLSLEMSHSRVIGTEDPVLPTGLLSAISDAYLPNSLGLSKKYPLASPFYAPDSVLRQFPPTLLFASSNDPLLDDSVVFNQRLRSFGVESDLFAAQNLPHAYLGLGTAGFPEAKQVQEQCVEWLLHQLNSHELNESSSDTLA